jgi:hypothetical protein
VKECDSVELIIMGHDGIHCQDSVTLAMNLGVQLTGTKILTILSPKKEVKVLDPLQNLPDLLFFFLQLQNLSN